MLERSHRSYSSSVLSQTKRNSALYGRDDSDLTPEEKFVNYRGAKCLNHLKILKSLWQNILNEKGKDRDVIAIDATCGNGNDSLYLAKELLTETSGMLWCIDIQETAIINTREKMMANLSPSITDKRIHYVHDSHENFPKEIIPDTVLFINYNLGYLPGVPRTDEEALVTTTTYITTKSIRSALLLLKRGGLLSVIAYPKNEGGGEEMEAVSTIFTELDSLEWRVYNYHSLNKPLSPSLFVVYRI